MINYFKSDKIINKYLHIWILLIIKIKRFFFENLNIIINIFLKRKAISSIQTSNTSIKTYDQNRLKQLLILLCN